jgi:hypothetical protein
MTLAAEPVSFRGEQASAPDHHGPAADGRAAPQDADELGETAALALMYVAGDFLADPPDAPRHVVAQLEAWLRREYREGRVLPWLVEHQTLNEWANGLSGELRTAAWLIGRSSKRPHLRSTTFRDLLRWTADELDQAAPGWERRDVLLRFADGWTIEAVTAAADQELEGRLMRHCLDAQKGAYHDGIASLRDPMGRPHVTLIIEGDELTEAYGRAHSKPKAMLLERVEVFAREARLRG